MIAHYLDSNAWVKRYCRELGSGWVAQFVARGPRLACATLGLIEVVATLARKGKAGELSPDALRSKLAQARKDWRAFAEVRLTSEVAELALEVAQNHALRGADAIHLASAISLRRTLPGRQDGVVIVTSDQELANAAGQLGITVLDPEQAEMKSAVP